MQILQEDVDFYKSSCLSLYDYPPRIFFDVIPTKNAEPCTLQLRVSGLSRDVNFHISLRNAIITKGKGMVSLYTHYTAVNLRSRMYNITT